MTFVVMENTIKNMRILIADSGSTKTDWLFADENGNTLLFQTKGINPFFRTADDISQELKTELLPKVESADHVFFYGAGIINQEKGEVVKSALSLLYPAAVIKTNSDVMVAPFALFKNEEGIACNIGTGSYACLYDGEDIKLAIPPLGYLLGDECSGAVLGRKLLGDYFKNVMPDDVKLLFDKRYQVTLAEVLEKVYRSERPNKYLAGFAPFLSENHTNKYILRIITESVKEFFDRNIMRIPDATNYNLGFCGSIAWAFNSIIEEIAKSYGFKTPIIIQKPIDRLKEYHLSQK